MDEITSNDNNRIREFGRNGYLTLNPRRVSAKTGTADFFMDNLTVGWTPNLLTAVWVGNAQRSCLQPKDIKYVTEPDRAGATPSRGRTVTRIRSAHATSAHYGLKPLQRQLPGLRSPRRRRLGVQRCGADLALVHVGRAQGRPGHLVQAARRRHRRRPRQRRRQLLPPRHAARRQHQLHVLRPGPASRRQTCTYAGPIAGSAATDRSPVAQAPRRQPSPDADPDSPLASDLATERGSSAALPGDAPRRRRDPRATGSAGSRPDRWIGVRHRRDAAANETCTWQTTTLCRAGLPSTSSRPRSDHQ